MKILTSVAPGTSHRRPAMLDTGSWQRLSSLAMLTGFGMLAAHLVQSTDAFADGTCAVMITATVNQSIAEADADLLLAQFAKYEIAGAKSCVAGGAKENPANCSVTLESPGGAKLNVVKAVKNYTGLGLKESKALVDVTPSVIKKGASKQDVESGKAQLQQAGGTATTACVTETIPSENPANCSVTLESPGGAKLNVVKAVKNYTGLGLKESKALVDVTPSVIKKGASKQDVESGKAQLQQAGGTATTACVTETIPSLCSVTMSIHLDEDLETAEAEALKGQLTKSGAMASTACEP